MFVCGGLIGNELCDCGVVDVYDVVKGEWGIVDGDNEDGDCLLFCVVYVFVVIGN